MNTTVCPPCREPAISLVSRQIDIITYWLETPGDLNTTEIDRDEPDEILEQQCFCANGHSWKLAL